MNESKSDQQSETAAADRPCGRILRVKRGYNPNSSSMGSELNAFFALPKALLILPVLFGTAAAVIAAALGRGRSDAAGPRVDDAAGAGRTAENGAHE